MYSSGSFSLLLDDTILKGMLVVYYFEQLVKYGFVVTYCVNMAG